MATKIPSEFRKLVCVKTTPKFRDAVSVVSVPTPTPGPGQVLVRTRYAGINASDVNATAGRYESAPKQLPFDLGFESVGEVVAVGPDVQGLKVCQKCSSACLQGPFTHKKSKNERSSRAFDETSLRSQFGSRSPIEPKK